MSATWNRQAAARKGSEARMPSIGCLQTQSSGRMRWMAVGMDGSGGIRRQGWAVAGLVG